MTGTEKMSLCVSQAVEATDFVMHHQPHKQQCGRDRDGEKDMGGAEGDTHSTKNCLGKR